MENIIIRKVTSNDFTGLVNLYDVVWQNVDYDKQKKANFVLNESKGVCYCAECEGIIIGSRTSFFQNMYYGKRKLNCVQCGDSCVHPSFQGKGLFQRMNNAFLKDFFSGQPGELIYNISVIASRRSYEKLGWNYIESLMKLRKFVNPLRFLLKIKFDIRRLNIPIIWEHDNEVQKIPSDLLKIREAEFSKSDILHIKYDEETFYWRMKSESGIKSYFAPNLGYVIYKIGHRDNLIEVELGEMFLYDYTKQEFKKLLKSFNKSIKPDILWVLVSEGHPLRKIYGESGFFANPKQKYLHHGVRVETEEMKNICYNPTNWAISSLDIDTF